MSQVIESFLSLPVPVIIALVLFSIGVVSWGAHTYLPNGKALLWLMRKVLILFIEGALLAAAVTYSLRGHATFTYLQLYAAMMVVLWLKDRGSMAFDYKMRSADIRLKSTTPLNRFGLMSTSKPRPMDLANPDPLAVPTRSNLMSTP